MRRLDARGVVSAAVVLALFASGCGGLRSSAGTPAEKGTAQPISDGDFDPSRFTHSTEVTNRWNPLVPGARFTWEGHALEDGEPVSRAVVFTVTDMTKTVDGVRTVVTWDRDFNEGKREETEIAFFAQDDEGNVWHLGEYPEEYEGSEIVKTPTWIAGIHGARPGISMLADPSAGTADYAEGWGPDIGWNDRARPDQVGAQTCVPVGCYEDVVVIDEFNPDEPGAHQLKYYAPGVGGVRVGWRGANEEEQEELVLVDLERLDARQLAAVDEKVLEQEERAYQYSADVYGRTEPIEHSPMDGV
jgi:hypothetical protein